jgi:hypothetical protein
MFGNQETSRSASLPETKSCASKTKSKKFQIYQEEEVEHRHPEEEDKHLEDTDNQEGMPLL